MHCVSSRAYRREMPPNPEKRSDARWRLVVSASSAFARRGFHGASLTDIATEAGVTTGSIYSHFRDKEDLFAAVVENLASDLCVELRGIERLRGYGGEATADAAARFRVLLDDWPEWPLLVHEVLSLLAHGRDWRDADEIAASCQAVHNELARTLERVAGLSGIRLARPGGELAGAVGAALHGLALQRVISPSLVPDGAFDQAVAAILTQTAASDALGEGDALPSSYGIVTTFVK
jgi:AcrR family transcriptional regulator